MNHIKLTDNSQYIHSVTKAYFCYVNNMFITINEDTGQVECYDEEQMGSNINYLLTPIEQLELDEDAEAIQHETTDQSSEY